MIPLYDLVVFLVVPAEVRLRRLRERERRRYGDAIEPEGPLHTAHLQFLEWASQYDDGPPTVRSLAAHRIWLKKISCPVLELRGDATLENHVNAVKERVHVAQHQL